MINAGFLRFLIGQIGNNKKNKNILEKMLDFFGISVHSIRAF
jgi:hypothetical protein